MTTPHKHAEILRAIADGLEVEGQTGGQWIKATATYNPLSHYYLEWRIKPRMIVCGKHSWPEPMRAAPSKGSLYWATDIHVGCEGPLPWDDDVQDTTALKRGLCHTTSEAAEQHARALIAISQGDVYEHLSKQTPSWAVQQLHVRPVQHR